ncbi:XBOS33 [Symbiodinium necroappetens]|uniref:XBOS33 protein n=1 Tax=Symbiodinium necroappetens TaxID=1628268 RepID=A0A812JBU5_9DINO|nr:XBOS33 [Symbiodinium necroappetens]
MVELLLRSRADANFSTLGSQVAPLHMAAFDGSVEMMKLLLNRGADVNVRDRHGQTPLFFAPSPETCVEPLAQTETCQVYCIRKWSTSQVFAIWN